MDNFSRLFAVFQSSTHKSVNLKRPFHSFIVNICQCSGAVIAVTGESRGPAMASQLHRFGNVKEYRPFHSGCGSQQVHIFWAVILLSCSRARAEQTGGPGHCSPRSQPRQQPCAARSPRHPRGGGKAGGEGGRWPGGCGGTPVQQQRTTPPFPAPRRAPAGHGNASPLLCPLFNFHSAF